MSDDDEKLLRDAEDAEFNRFVLECIVECVGMVLFWGVGLAGILFVAWITGSL